MNVCGKFRQDQLRRPAFSSRPKLWEKAVGIGSLVPGLLAGGAATGQNFGKPLTEQLEIDHSLSYWDMYLPQPIKRVRRGKK
ncbi:MAG: hypothetical protein R2788_07370 [Saprospiraceae bacterium]